MSLPQHIYNWPPQWQELWAERAAIMEFLGNLPHDEAEKLAAADIRAQEHNESEATSHGSIRTTSLRPVQDQAE